MGRLICLFGPDGSGKSTLAVNLKEYYAKRGVKSALVWMRGTHSMSSLIARVLSHFSNMRGNCNPYYKICMPKKLKGLWLYIEFLSIIPIMIRRLILNKLLYDITIAERSPLDFIIWLVSTLKRPEVMASLPVKAVTSISLNLCDVIIYIGADEGVLLSRKENPQERAFLSRTLPIYNKVKSELTAGEIDTSNCEVSECLRAVLVILNESGVR